jgi:ribosomal-protein-alanine N-acetyltransferase
MQRSSKISYILSIMAGFCSYYIKPVGTLHGIQKIAIIFSLVIYEQFRRKGIGTYLLKTSFTELKLNGIWDIYLCMNKDNSPAVSLYKKLGFAIIEKNCNIAEDKEGGHYLMHLVL